MYVVTTGAASFRASSPISGPASARSAPPPAQMSGRSAAANSSAARSRSAGATDVPAAGAPTSGAPVAASADSRSVGTARYTGPVGADSARSPDSSAAAAISSAPVSSPAALVTATNIAVWSRVSCRVPPYTPSRRSRVAMSVAITSTGEPEAIASPVAPSVLAAPGPVVTTATPSRPVARA